LLYNEDFIKSIDLSVKPEVGEFSIDVDGGFADVPVLETLRALDNTSDFDTQSKIAHYSLKSRKVTVMYNGVPIAAPFITNSQNDSWDNIEVFKVSPLALQFVLSICMANILKKSIPSQKSTPEAVAGVEPQKI
jgi:hypothetical protein